MGVTGTHPDTGIWGRMRNALSRIPRGKVFTLIVVSMIGVAAFNLYLGSQAPIITVRGFVVKTSLDEDTDSDGIVTHHTDLIVRDNRSVLWALKANGWITFTVGDEYVFKIHMWAIGRIWGASFTEGTPIYRIVSYGRVSH